MKRWQFLWLLVGLSIGVVLLFDTLTAKAVNVMDQVNRDRMRHGLYVLIPLATLQAAAEASAQTQARRGRMGHCGTMPMGTAEGVGHGRLNPFRFRACFHSAAYVDRRGRYHPDDFTTSHRYGGAAIVGGYTCIVIDKDRNHGAIGSGGGGRGIVRRGLFRRRR